MHDIMEYANSENFKYLVIKAGSGGGDSGGGSGGGGGGVCGGGDGGGGGSGCGGSSICASLSLIWIGLNWKHQP